MVFAIVIAVGAWQQWFATTIGFALSYLAICSVLFLVFELTARRLSRRKKAQIRTAKQLLLELDQC